MLIDTYEKNTLILQRNTLYCVKGKKAIPLQAWTGP